MSALKAISPAMAAVNTVLKSWSAKELEDLNRVAFQIGRFVGAKDVAYAAAESAIRTAADVRGYPGSMHVGDIHAVITSGLESGISAPLSIAEFINKRVANDNFDRARFNIVWFKDVAQTQAKDWLIDGVFGVGDFSNVVGKPGAGKSLIVMDAGLHVSADLPWHGRAVRKGLVVYFAAERKTLTERRVAAFREYHRIADVPFVVVSGKLDLTSGLIDAKALANEIHKLESQCGQMCVWAIIDTLSRTFGGGDQNASKDMGRYVQAIDELIRQTSAHVTVIHHTTWKESRGKGAIDLDGAVDASFNVTKSGKTFSLVCDGTNDGEEGPITKFSIKSVDIGQDSKGEITTAPVVVPIESNLPLTFAHAHSEPRLSGFNAIALKTIQRAITEKGESPPLRSVGIPNGVKAVSRETWREFFDTDTANEPATSAARRFKRAADALISKEIVCQSGLWVWENNQTVKGGQRPVKNIN
jgi:hypothetical protein